MKKFMAGIVFVVFATSPVLADNKIDASKLPPEMVVAMAQSYNAVNLSLSCTLSGFNVEVTDQAQTLGMAAFSNLSSFMLQPDFASAVKSASDARVAAGDRFGELCEAAHLNSLYFK